MGLIPVGSGQSLNSKPQQKTGGLRPVMPAKRMPAPRPDIRQSQNYLNAVKEADKYKQEAQQANSGWGMTKNFVKAIPGAVRDTLLQTPAKFIASISEVPEIIWKGGQTSQRDYKIPGLSPFKSFQSDFENTANDVIEGRKGLGSAAWGLAQVPLAGLEMVGIGSGINKGIKAFRGASGVSQGLKAAAPEVLDAFLPTTRGVKKGTTEAKLRNELADLQTQRMRASLAVERPQTQGYKSGIKFEATPIVQNKVKTPKVTETDANLIHAQKAKEKIITDLAQERKALEESVYGGQTREIGAMDEGFESYGGSMNMRRFSEHSPEYREYFKKNGKKPTLEFWKNKVAEEIAQGKHHSSGEVKAIDDYISSIKSQPLQEGVAQSILATKGKITNPKINYKKFIEENLGIRDKAPDTRGFNSPIKQVEKELQRPDLWVRDLPEGTPKQGMNRFYPDVLRSGERSLQNQGSTGEELLKVMENQRVAGDLQSGKWKALVNQFTGQLNDAQKSNLTDVLEGKANPMDATVGASAKVMRNLLNKIQREAVGAGLETGKIENYFPRKYNWSEMIKSGRKEQIYQHMVETGQASTKAEAEQFFKDFIIKNSERKAGNLEYERMFDVPGYERDPEKALTMYAETAAKRITETKEFGKGDEVISDLINKISDEGGDYRSAQKIFDYVYKGEDTNAFTRALLGYNAFTKLSLAFFSNITQSANTAAKGGLLNTLKGAGQALAQGIRATKGKSYDDIAMLSNALDEHITLQESGLSNKFMKGAMYLFQKVENFNRRTAANTGVNFAKELASKPESAYAIRQLKSLGIDIQDIVKGKLTQEQLLTAANKLTAQTQFKVNALTQPQAWRTPLGKVLTQFKGFSFMQTKFIRDEIVKEAAKGNIAPLARFLMIAPVASYATQTARNLVNQANSKTSQDNVDFRQGDLYRKAMGDLPSDIATQLQYANSKKDKWYTTGIKNLKNFTSPVIGPTGGDILEVMSGLEQKSKTARDNEQWYSNHPLAQSDANLDLKRFAVSKVPFVGRNLTNTVFGYGPTVAKKAKEEAIQAINNNDTEAFRRALTQDPYLNDKEVLQRLISDITADYADKTQKRVELNRKFNPFYTK